MMQLNKLADSDGSGTKKWSLFSTLPELFLVELFVNWLEMDEVRDFEGTVTIHTDKALYNSILCHPNAIFKG